MPQAIKDWLSILPGMVALLGAAVGYGSMRARMAQLEKDMEPVKKLAQDVARIDERTQLTQANVKDVKGSVERLVERFIDGEHRSFNNKP